MTRRQLSRHEREQRMRAMVISGVIVALVLVVIIPAVGYYREVLTKGSQPLVTVAGEPIVLDDFEKLYGFRSAMIDAQLGQLQQFAASQPSKPGAPNPFAQQLQQLQQQRSELDNDLVDEMVDQKLVEQEAARRNVQVTRADEDAFITREFGDQPQPTPQASPTAPASPVPTVDPFARLQTTLTNIRTMNEDDYRRLVVHPSLLGDKLQSDFAKQVPGAEPQIHARHILVDTEEGAQAAVGDIQRGVPFEEVARRVSKDESNKDKGGDLGWFGKGKMVPQFEDAAFTMQPGQLSQPIRSGFGWHVIQVLEKDDNHPIDDARRNELAEKAYREWLDKTKDDLSKNKQLVYSVSSDKFAWAHSQVDKARGVPRGSS
jgi:parvulin-like peptidyl-prolyl isomerase